MKLKKRWWMELKTGQSLKKSLLKNKEEVMK